MICDHQSIGAEHGTDRPMYLGVTRNTTVQNDLPSSSKHNGISKALHEDTLS